MNIINQLTFLNKCEREKQKFLKIMKLSAVFLFIATLQIMATGYAQTVSLNLNMDKTSIGDVFREIERQTELSFIFSDDISSLNKEVSVNVHKKNIKDVLNNLFTDTDLGYQILNEKLIVIAPKAILQQITITGKVTDANGNLLPGASVVVKGTVQGTVTDINGAYSLQVPNENTTLVFSFVGFTTQEFLVGNQRTINVTLNEEASTIEEVVVIGYGTVRRRDLTGAVTSLKSEDITQRPGPNPIESIQGKVAGLDITRTSGQAGADINMQLRGVRSFSASGNPLVLIDGLPGDYSTLNSNDIESMEILKDASSTAVFGSAGANGVILISTKKGQAGKMSVNFDAYYGWNGWSITPKMRTGDDYLKTKRDAYKYVWDAAERKWTTTGAMWQSSADDELIFGAERYKLLKEAKFVDWADLFLQKNAAIQNYSLSVSGGNDRTKGYISLNYTDEIGQYRGDDYNRYSTSMRIEHNPYKWLSVGSSLQGSYVVRDQAQDKLENALTTDPLVRAYNEDGTLNPYLGNNVYNLLLDYQPGVYTNQANNLRINMNPFIEIKPVKGLSLLSRVGIEFKYNNNYRFDGIGSVTETYTNNGNAIAIVRQNRNYGYQWENILTYQFSLYDVHDFTLTGVSSWYDMQELKTTMTQRNIASNNFKWYDMQGGVNTEATTEYQMWKTMGYVVRLNYSYMGRYIFSAAARYDGSSVLYETNRWDAFPTVSGAWRISDESFMDFSRTWLNSLKLRLSWGISGSAKIDPYSSVNALERIDMMLGGHTHPMYRNSQFLTNSGLGWEKSASTNFGVDAILLKNRIDLSVDYYITNTDGVIWAVDLPAIYGMYATWSYHRTNMNLAETQNKGLEMTLNTRNVHTADFQWNSNLIFTRYKEKIQKLTGGKSNNIQNSTTGYHLAIGEPVKSFYNYKTDGIWQISEEADAAVFNRRPGDIRIIVPGMERLGEGVYRKTADDDERTQTWHYTDLAEAQKYNSALTATSSTYAYSDKDHQIIGQNTPKWTLGFQNEFRYKNFDLTVYAYMRWGQMIDYCMPGWYQPNAFQINASPSRTIPVHFDYWTPENPSNDFPVMNYLEATSQIAGFRGLNFVEGSFFKLKNITFGYTLPKDLSTKLFIERFRVYATITNPLVIAKSHILKEYDPEMNGSLEYPLTKQVVIGLNLTF